MRQGSLADSVVHLKLWPSAAGGNDHWYGVLAAAYNWLEASALAPTFQLGNQSAYLATIKNGAENSFVFDSVVTGLIPGTVQDQFYLGGVKVNGFWTWITSEPLCYFNWAPGEPNNANETAISMWGPRHSPTGTWNNTLPRDSANPLARFWAVLEWGPLDTSVTNLCGNLVVECPEHCDDGNTASGDGCDSGCRYEPAVCGDGILQFGETCDDGNLLPGDGCDPFCRIEPVCGNGIVQYPETCDDGNQVSGDGCDSDCQREPPVCGDGVLEYPEECDDGNLTPGDGCEPNCQWTPVCGNARRETGEECDDGNTTAGDCCDPTCQFERGPECCRVLLPGDISGDLQVTSSDIILLLNFIFRGGPAPYPCVGAGDVNCSGSVSSSDLIALVNYIFKNGLPPCDICNDSPLANSCF